MSNCGQGSEESRKRCSRKAEQVRERCVEERDEGYNACTQTREERQKNCCTWIPCSWACKAWHWVVSVVCVAWEWISNVVCVVWETIKEVVCVAWVVLPAIACAVLDAVSAALGAIVALIEAALNWAWSVVGLIVDIFLAIPIIGRVISWLLEAGKAVFNAIISLPDAALTVLGIMPEKKLRLGVIIMKDVHGRWVASESDVLRAVQCTINIYRQQLNVRVLPIRYAQYQMPLDSEEVASRDYIFYDQEPRREWLLQTCCKACAFGEDVGRVGAAFHLGQTVNSFFGNGRRLLGYGAPVVAFSVRSFTDGAVGCSLGPLTNYVTVAFQDSQAAIPAAQLDASIPLGRVSTLAHEVGHACNLVWHEDGTGNLMSKLTQGDRHCNLTRFQKALVRASRHVTYV